MAGEDGSVVLPLSIDLSGVTSGLDAAATSFGEHLATAINAAVGQATADVPKGRGGGTATPARDVAAPATGQAGAQTGGVVKAKGDIAFNAEDVSRELQAAISGHKFQLNLDQNYLINQIQTALNHAYNLTIGEMNRQPGAPSVQPTTAPATAVAAPVTDTVSRMSARTIDLPGEVRRSLNEALYQTKKLSKNAGAPLPTAIDDLYADVAASLKAVGRTLPQATDPIGKALALYETFGDNLLAAGRDLVRIFPRDPKGNSVMPEGMNFQEQQGAGKKILQERLGIAPTGMGTLPANLAGSAWIGARQSAFWTQIAEAAQATQAPMPTPVQAPAPAAMPVTPAASSESIEAEQLKLRIGIARATNLAPIETSSVGSVDDLIQQIGRMGTASARSRQGQPRRGRSGGLAAQGPGLPHPDLIGPTRPISGQDAEAEEEAQAQLGPNNAGVRGPISWSALLGGTGPADIDLRAAAQMAMRPLGMTGSLRGLLKGAESGSYYRIKPVDDNGESYQRVQEILRRKNRQTVPGIDEQVKALSPRGAIEDFITAQYGDAGTAFLARPEVHAELGKAIRQASRMQPVGMPGSRGYGESTRASGESFAHMGGGAPISAEAIRADEEAYYASQAGGMDAETRAAAIRASNLESQGRIAGGIGLSDSEKLKKELAAKLPSFMKVRMAAGGLPQFPELMETILNEVARGADQERGRLSPEGQAQVFGVKGEKGSPDEFKNVKPGSSAKFARTRLDEIQKLLIKGAAESLTDDDIAKTLGLQPGALSSEQAGQYRTGLGSADARELKGFMQQVKTDVLGQINPAGYARIVADKNNSQSVGTTKTTPFGTEAADRADIMTGRSYTAPRRQKTDAEKELAKLDAEAKAYSAKIDDALKARSEAGSDVDKIKVPPPFATAYPEMGTRRSELQGLLGGVRQTRLGAQEIERRRQDEQVKAGFPAGYYGPAVPGEPPSAAVLAERAEQDRLQAIASSKASTRRDATGDDLRRAAAKVGQVVGGPLAADPRSPYFSSAVLSQLGGEPVGELTAAGGGGARPPRGRETGGIGAGGPGGGGRGGGEVSGAIHVIVDGQPIAVTFEGAGPATTAGASPQARLSMAGTAADYDWKKGRSTLHRQTTDSAQRAFGQEVERLRAAGLSDAAIKKTAKSAGLGVAADAFFNEDDVAGGGFGSGGGTGGGRAALNLRRRKLGLQPITYRTPATLESIDESDVERSTIGAEVQRARRFEPRRGFTASVTDIFTNMFPFIARQSAAINKFAREGTQYAGLQAKTPTLIENREAITGHIADVEASRAEAQGKLDAAKASHQSTRSLTTDVKAWDKELRNSKLSLGAATDALSAHNVELDFQKTKTEQARAALPGVGGKAAAFGAGAVAAGGAIAVGMAISQFVNTIITDTAAALGPAIDRALGSPMFASELVSGIAKAGASGTFAAATANAMAQVGLAPSADQALLTQRALGIAGNRNLAQQGDVIRGQTTLARQGRDLPVGVDESVRTSQNGIFGSAIGLPGVGDFTQSTQELIAQNLTGLPDFAQRQVGAATFRNPQEAVGGMMPWDPGFLERAGAITPGPLPDELEKFNKNLADGSKELDNLNGNAAAAGSGLKLVTATTDDEMAAAQEFGKKLRDAGFDKLAGVVETKGLLLQGGESNAFNAAQYLAAEQRGASGYNVQNLLLASEPQRRAREGLRMQQLGFALGRPEIGGTSGGRSIGGRWDGLGLTSGSGSYGGLIQQQFGMGYAANPLPTGTQITGLGKAAGINLSGTAKGYNDIAVAAADAVKQTKAFVAQELPDFSTEFDKAIDDVSSLGRQISNIKIGQETKQASLAAAEYSFSIYQANRSLKDAKYLTGQLTAENKDSVGYLQKQEYLLNRQSQALSLQMSQRQINFQTSLAGFQAPGITGQERAARMEEAKLEASYAQKQLDIQKQLYGLSGDEFMAQAKRQVTDLQKQIALMVRGRSLALSTVQANKDIDALNTRLGLAKGRADSIYQSAVAKRNAMYQDAAELVASTGKDLAQITNDVINSYRKIYATLPNGGTGHVYDPLTNAQKTQEIKTGINITGSDPRLGHAQGIVGTTRGRTDITVGEADGEMVAVVKGPKTMAVMGGMGGGAGVSIGPFIIQGGDVTREKADQLAREITDLVEARLGMKARLVGIRSTTG